MAYLAAFWMLGSILCAGTAWYVVWRELLCERLSTAFTASSCVRLSLGGKAESFQAAPLLLSTLAKRYPLRCFDVTKSDRRGCFLHFWHPL